MRTNDMTKLRARLLLAVGAMGAAYLHNGRRADAQDEPKMICLSQEANGECPTESEALVQIRAMDPDGCSPYLDSPQATLIDIHCCYDVRYDCSPVMVVGCSFFTGHPLLIEGRPIGGDARPIAGWGGARLPKVDASGLRAEERQILALHWARIGAAEYVSIAGFQRFAMDLMANGAPPDLIARAQRAAQDEVRHARLAFTLASAFAEGAIGPAPLDIPAAVPVHRSIAEFAVATAQEGCAAETLSACLLAEALDRASDPAVVAALTQMRRDEDRHAALAWEALTWALSRDPASAGAIDAAFAGAIAGLSVAGFAHPGGLERFGLLRPSSAEACRANAIRLIIEPCRQALLGARTREAS